MAAYNRNKKVFQNNDLNNGIMLSARFNTGSRSTLSFVPKKNQWEVLHTLGPLQEMSRFYHNRPLPHDPVYVPAEFMYARFAWPSFESVF
jgi:hypothetical protein